MFMQMYGLGCAICGRPAWAWVDGRVWPCSCPTLASPAEPAATTARRVAARHRAAERARASRLAPRRAGGPAVPA
ncbi:hypothetical protein [Actinomycetospora cinnamomea]|uniref:Uncharacterized protein n=1 Tax=Actinomycetospora cinnamomea TaxID=663609 RepID=A0A2U1F2G2_9PSEU|nr:hypothetical protein [Actinomycetospora cinnamomea]PVZ06356.1 hypothetical protein C8D89_11394 [Actinomycetospora cinnamomea]